MMPIKTSCLIVFLLISVFFVGCTQAKEESGNSIISISLECLQPAKGESCKDQFFDDTQSIILFENAINHAVIMPGELNYIAEYEMMVTYTNDTELKYHLSLGTDRTMNGLLVNTSNSSQGYEIPLKYANELREQLEIQGGLKD
ncbi:hypothetical protein ACK8P5_17375 [Paenibacillus sp. EC2-1]|uniref:hypothetical protein n=1 Tax=Paenibacillus sp. EC2-1 TaxID=3388665 RepID=UPI003BEF3951